MESARDRAVFDRPIMVYGLNRTAQNSSVASLNGSDFLLATWNLSNSSSSSSSMPGANDTLTAVLFQPRFGLLHIVTTSVILGLIILCTIVGNVFVVAAIILEKNLQSVSNYLILSLAVADLMVATLVMPISALNELSKSWWLGLHLCDLWICFDILCCTASILHLVGIAVDRYWAVTNVDYIRVRTARRIGLMIVAVWAISLVISIPARFSLSESDRRSQITNGTCAINEEKIYTIFSTVGAFYLPMLFMMVIYIKIYQTARKRIRKKAFKAQQHQPKKKPTIPRTQCSVPAPVEPRTVADNNSSDSGEHPGEKPEVATAAMKVQTTSFTQQPPLPAADLKVQRQQQHQYKQAKQHHKNGRHGNRTNKRSPEEHLLTPQSRAAHLRDKVEHKRERKAARTLAIITGCFLICWIPFFLRAVVCPFYMTQCTELIPDSGNSFILWLGYMNSLLNPVIYTIFSPDFRNAFSKILFGRYHRRGYR